MTEERTPKIPRWAVATASIVAALFVLACLAPIPVRVHRTLDGILWDTADAGVSETVRITMDGTVWRHPIRLLFGDVYEGTFAISKDWRTEDAAMRLALSPWGLAGERGRQKAEIAYYDGPSNRWVVDGLLTPAGDFSRLVILQFQGPLETPRTRVISAPAATRDEAEALAAQLLPDFFS
jgi:hypothetical protein